MACLLKDASKISAYRDRRFPGNQEELKDTLKKSTTLYIGNMSFYATDDLERSKRSLWVWITTQKTPCAFCFVLYYSREDTEDAVKYISVTILDDRPVCVDFDSGFQEGRQWGCGRSGGQVQDEYRTDYDPGRGGYGKLVQRELEDQRHLVDYGAGFLGAFAPVVPAHYGRHERNHGHGGSYRHNRGEKPTFP